jgi:hypothetical protein
VKNVSGHFTTLLSGALLRSSTEDASWNAIKGWRK